MPLPTPSSVRTTLLGACVLVLLGAGIAGAQTNPAIPHRPGTAEARPSPSPARASYSAVAPPYADAGWPGRLNNDKLDPPDPDGAAGPKGVIEIDNHGVVYTAKTGNLGGALYWQVDALDSLFIPGRSSHASGTLVDPHARYDPGTQRFFLTALLTQLSSGPPADSMISYLYLAVSKSSHPATATAADWYLYRIDATEIVSGSRYGLDFPGIGFDGQTLVVTGNMFRLPVDGFAFLHVRIVAIDKIQATQGVLAYTMTNTPNTGLNREDQAFTLQPATVVGAASPGNVVYLAEIPYDGPYDQLRLWALTDPLGSPSLTSTLVPIPDRGASIGGDAPQCGSVGPLRTWFPVMRGDVCWDSGVLWSCMTGSIDSPARAIVRYHATATNGYPSATPTLVESGAFDGGPGTWTYQPNLGRNAAGDMAIVYTQSATGVCATTMVASRRAGADGFSTPQAVNVSPFGKWNWKWGDYFAAVPDPVDGGFWLSGEFANGTENAGYEGNWGVWWTHLRYPDAPLGWPVNGQAMRFGQLQVGVATNADDGAGGMFSAWTENRALYGVVWRVIVNRLDATGARPSGWPANGVVAFDSSNSNAPAANPPSLVSDGAGGAFVAWSIAGGTQLQHVTASGSIAGGWPANGLRLGATLSLAAPGIQADGAGGVIVTWEGASILAQRVTSGGQLLWSADGVPLGSGGTPQLIADGSGGAIVAWEPPTVQHVSAAGAPLWSAGGVALADGEAVHLTSDGSGGAIVAYQFFGDDGSYDVGAQRVTASGAIAPGWPDGGLLVCNAARDQTQPMIVTDGAGGAIVVWMDNRAFPTTRRDVYASRVTADGTLATGWTANGTPVCVAPGDQVAPVLASDGSGGAVIAWQDRRGHPTCSSGGCEDDVRITRFLPDGSLDATEPINGGVLVDAAGAQTAPSIAVLGAGRFGIAWADGRYVTGCVPYCSSSVYAQLASFDVTAPSAATDLDLRVGLNTAVATWSASGNDGLTGDAEAYDLRWSNAPITAANFTGQTHQTSGPVLGPPGSRVCVALGGLPACTPLYVAVRMRDHAGNWSAMSNVALHVTDCSGSVVAACRPEDSVGIPDPAADRWTLSPPSPNPATSHAAIRFEVPGFRTGQNLRLALFDLSGRRVRTLATGAARAGVTTLDWDLRTDAGARVHAGFYMLRLAVGGAVLTRAVVVR